MNAAPQPRAELFRLLGDEGRLRLLALCVDDELTVGELAQLLGESQPQLSKKSQPLRDAGLLLARREGTRTLLRAQRLEGDPVVEAAFIEGRQLCERDGSLARVAAVVAERDAVSRQYFESPSETGAAAAVGEVAAGLLDFLPLLAPLLPGRALAVDVGTGEGTLLPLLSPLYERVIAIDRSPARLARCGARIAALALPNVRLREGAVEDAELTEDIAARGGADLVLMVRVLHHAARPQDAVAAATRLLRAGGHLVIVDHVPHNDERVREQGHVWLGFAPAKLRSFLEQAGLEVRTTAPLPTPRAATAEMPSLHMAVGRRGAALQLV